MATSSQRPIYVHHHRLRLPNRKIIELLTREIRCLTGSAGRSVGREAAWFPLETEDVEPLLAA